MSPTAPPNPAERFAAIIATLLAMVGARLERPGKPGLAGPLTLAIAIRLQGIRNRITRYVARWQAGALAPPPRRNPAPRRQKATPGKWDHLPRLPRGRAWLVRLVPGIGVGASQLRALLDDPDMQAMIAAAPQIGRTLRPYWHMLTNQPPPDILRRPGPDPASPPPLTPSPPSPPRPAQARGVSPPRPARIRPAQPPRPPAPEVAGPAALLPGCTIA